MTSWINPRTTKRKSYYKIAITREELAIAVQHREKTGEPINGYVRRLIRQAYEQEKGE